MKPIYLELCGINSFSEPASVNFDELLDQGLFGIFGDTGSGKSTILDSIGFALYGSVSRDGANSADFINFRCEKGYVIFVFEIFFEGARRTYRVEREIKRKKDGATAQNFVVYEQIDGKFITVEDGVSRGNAFLQKVIGLKQDDFEKCIALPQGEFARFIKEAPGKRLEIVSRLFDLERFGVNLSRRASARSADLTRDMEVLAARLEQYAEATEETLNAAIQEIASRAAAEETYRQRVLDARVKEKELHALVDRRKEFEKVSAWMARLKERSEEMARLERELGRLDAAKAVLSAEREKNECERLLLDAERKNAYAAERAQKARELKEGLPAFDEAAAEKELEELSLLKGKAELTAEAEREKVAALKELSASEEKYAEVAKRTVDPNYEEQLKELLALQEQLGAGDLYEFLFAQKDALYRGEYEKFALELKGLEGKYPVIAPDSRPLIERYTALSEGDKLEFSDLKKAFEGREKAKKAAERSRLDLEGAQRDFLINKNRLTALSERIAALKEQISNLEGRTSLLDLKTIESRIAERKLAKDRYLAQKARAEREMNEAELAVASSSANLTARRDAYIKASERLEGALDGFSDVAEAQTLISRYGDAESAKQTLKEYKDRVAAVSSKYEELKTEDYTSATEEKLFLLREEIASLEKEREENAGRLAVLRENEKRFRAMLTEKEALEKEFNEKKREAETAQRLSGLLRGGKFMEFVAEEYLQTVSCNASAQLLSLTGGRYFLRYSSSVGFGVGDNFNGGQLRAVSTLSGGETFLVSLSLALALSAEICARSARPIEFFFLDEGFGTLDEKLVDTVMDSLEKLKSKSFSIGIISHVEELKHRIERKLLVTKATEERGSRIATE